MSTSKEFKLQRLYISRCAQYGSTPNDFEGEVLFQNEMGEIKIRVDHALCKQILHLVADNMAKATKTLANNMTASVFDQDLAPQLSGPEIAGVTTAATNPDVDIPF